MSLATLCTFSVAGLELALPAGDIEEVTRHVGVTPVPLARLGMRGLAHARGRVIPVIDVRILLGLEPAPDGGDQVHVVARTPEGPVSLEVDRVQNVIEADLRRMVPPPEALAANLRRLLAGAIGFHDRLLLVLDLKQLLESPEAGGDARVPVAPEPVLAGVRT
jgi:purine-binding chemotaxis protein CheW